jgi:hypothetical protein
LRDASGASGEIDSPVENSKPVNWLIRNVRGAETQRADEVTGAISCVFDDRLKDYSSKVG